jgi:hypothetical protein
MTSIVDHMCINSCVAFVGPFSELEQCPDCNEPRYDQTRLNASAGSIKVPCSVFHTIPIAPQLQALWRHPDSAQKMQYCQQHTQALLKEIQVNDGFVKTCDDVLCGTAYLDAIRDQKILPDDILLMLSIDGVQVYENKESDCWIYIWIILDLSPEYRYKKSMFSLAQLSQAPRNPSSSSRFYSLGFITCQLYSAKGFASGMLHDLVSLYLAYSFSRLCRWSWTHLTLQLCQPLRKVWVSDALFTDWSLQARWITILPSTSQTQQLQHSRM